jgi:hypothetical protein
MSYARAPAPTLEDEKKQMIESTGVLDVFSL